MRALEHDAEDPERPPWPLTAPTAFALVRTLADLAAAHPDDRAIARCLSIGCVGLADRLLRA